jgi:hypothetical protein
MPALTTNTSATANDMASEIFGAGFTINSATYTGAAGSSATYSNGDVTNPNVLPGDTGVILSTGDVSDFANATGANNQAGGTSSNTSGPNNVAAFNTAAGNNTFDASYMEVNFTPLPGQTMLSIEFRFYSEEYNEWVYSNFNDIALVQLDGTTIPISAGSGEISVNSINDAAAVNPTNGNQSNDPNPGNGVFDSSNPNLYIDNASGAYATEMDGFTVTLSMDIPVTPGVAQTLLIGIADVGDATYDSSLVIASNTSAIDQDPTAVDDTGISTFGANPKTVDILANDTDPNGQSLTITQINGVAVTSGSTVTLSTGQMITLNANGTITIVGTAAGTGSTTFSYTVEDPDGNTDSAFVTFDANPICFVSGTMISTPRGLRPIEDLRSGDQVITRDDGVQTVRWAGLSYAVGRGKLAPVAFAPGSIGNDRTLLLSPQHRVLINDYRAELYFGAREVLVAAKHLVNERTITRQEADVIGYHHLLFDTHQVILGNDVWSESYHPGGYSLPGLDEAARAELFTLFPQLRSDPNGYGTAARLCVNRVGARLLGV